MIIDKDTIIGEWQQNNSNWLWEFKENGVVKVTDFFISGTAKSLEYMADYTMSEETVDISFDSKAPFPSQFKIGISDLVSGKVSLKKMK